MRTVTASDANRNFSALLREVAGGGSVVIVSRGTPVAKMSPVDSETSRQTAKNSLLHRLGRQRASGRRAWNRDELYQDRVCG